MPTPVTVGADSDEWIAVTSGNIPANAEVVIYGNERLVFPQPVEVVRTRAEVDVKPTPPDSAAASSTPANSPGHTVER